MLGLQHLAIFVDTHLSRRLGWPLDGRTDGGWIGWCRLDAELSVREVRLFQPVDNLVCLGGNTERVRLVYEITGKQGRYGGAPLLPQHRGTLFVNLSEEREHRNAPPSGRDLAVETRARILSVLLIMWLKAKTEGFMCLWMMLDTMIKNNLKSRERAFASNEMPRHSIPSSPGGNECLGIEC